MLTIKKTGTSIQTVSIPNKIGACCSKGSSGRTGTSCWDSVTQLSSPSSPWAPSPDLAASLKQSWGTKRAACQSSTDHWCWCRDASEAKWLWKWQTTVSPPPPYSRCVAISLKAPAASKSVLNQNHSQRCFTLLHVISGHTFTSSMV